MILYEHTTAILYEHTTAILYEHTTAILYEHTAAILLYEHTPTIFVANICVKCAGFTRILRELISPMMIFKGKSSFYISFTC